MIGSGMRADKIKTYHEMDDIMTDHKTSLKHRLKKVERGDLIW